MRNNKAQNAQNSEFLPAVITISWLNHFAYGWPDFKLTVPYQRASRTQTASPDVCPCISHRKMSISSCQNRPSLVVVWAIATSAPSRSEQWVARAGTERNAG